MAIVVLFLCLQHGTNQAAKKALTCAVRLRWDLFLPVSVSTIPALLSTAVPASAPTLGIVAMTAGTPIVPSMPISLIIPCAPFPAAPGGAALSLCTRPQSVQGNCGISRIRTHDGALYAMALMR